MSKVALIAKFVAAEGKRDEVLAVMAELLPAVNDEPGTEVYVMNADAAEADVVWFYEIYTDQDALVAHGGSEAMKAIGPKLAGLIVGRPEMHFLSPVKAKGVSL